MKKETLADKIAKQTFASNDFQKSWSVHLQAFGPILEPAFVNNYQARIHLTAALNKISRRDVKGGLLKLSSLKKFCEADADYAAYLFFLGLCFEFSGDKDNMISCYLKSGEYGHKFYLPYLKVAKGAHADAVFEVAEQNYKAAISCYDGTETDAQSKTILASAYTNLASCLTMMHRYSEAEEALAASEEVLPQQQGRDATKAILCAAMGKADEANGLLSEMEAQLPMFAHPTKKMVSEIMGGTHPHFHAVEINNTCIVDFWRWFEANAADFNSQLQSDAYDKFFSTIQAHLKSVFPFMERPCELGIQPTDYGYEITFADFYMVSLQNGYEQLIAACPDSLRQQWNFVIAH